MSPLQTAPGRYPPVFLLLLLAAGCSAAPEPANEQAAATKAEDALARAINNPPYGPIRPIQGRVHLGQESSTIVVCESNRAECLGGGRRNERPRLDCWLTNTEASARALRKLTGTEYQKDGAYWIRGTGRLATEPGFFGHLNAHACQVQMHDVTVFHERSILDELRDRDRAD